MDCVAICWLHSNTERLRTFFDMLDKAKRRPTFH